VISRALRLGFLWVDESGPRSLIDEAAASVLRIATRFAGTLTRRRAEVTLHRRRGTNLARVAANNQLDPAQLLEDVQDRLAGAIDGQWIVDTRDLLC